MKLGERTLILADGAEYKYSIEQYYDTPTNVFHFGGLVQAKLILRQIEPRDELEYNWYAELYVRGIGTVIIGSPLVAQSKGYIENEAIWRYQLIVGSIYDFKNAPEWQDFGD